MLSGFILDINFSKSGWLYTFSMYLAQSADGSRTVSSWPTGVSWGTAGAPTLSTGADLVDYIQFTTYNGGIKWIARTLGQGF